MKNIITNLLILLCALSIQAQNINWSSISESQSHLIYLDLGYDFGTVTGIGYGKKIDAFKPIIITADLSMPMGKNLFDDFEGRLGGHISFFEWKNFIASASIHTLVRRHETNLVRITSFGSKTALLAGIYKPKWNIAGEIGFENSFATHLKHSLVTKENFANIPDGWVSSSAGYFIYGIRASRSIKERFEISLRIGRTDARGKDQDALLPIYARIGLIYRL